jgi:hypothetical protein
MDLTQVGEITIASTVAAAVGAIVGFFGKTLITHFFTRDIERYKNELTRQLEQEKIGRKDKLDFELNAVKQHHETELTGLRQKHEEALSKTTREANEELAHLQTALKRATELEADLLKSRGEGYGEIWKLTGSLNLFGPPTDVKVGDFSSGLKKWYFEHGWVLTAISKRRYFLVQEVLSFALFQEIGFRRPADNILFGSTTTRPVHVLQQLRSTLLTMPNFGDEREYTPDELEKYVSSWKTTVLAKSGADDLAAMNWVVLQFVLSAFRSEMVKELGSRQITGVSTGLNDLLRHKFRRRHGRQAAEKHPYQHIIKTVPKIKELRQARRDGMPAGLILRR